MYLSYLLCNQTFFLSDGAAVVMICLKDQQRLLPNEVNSMCLFSKICTSIPDEVFFNGLF